VRFCAPGEFHYGFRLLIGGFVNPLGSGMRERGVWFLLPLISDVRLKFCSIFAIVHKVRVLQRFRPTWDTQGV